MIINFRHSFHLLNSPYIKLGLYIRLRIHTKGGNYAQSFVHNSRHDKLCIIAFLYEFTTGYINVGLSLLVRLLTSVSIKHQKENTQLFLNVYFN
jgi:hypothetical protein